MTALSLSRSELPEEIATAIRFLTETCLFANRFNDAALINRNVRNGVDALTAAILSRLGEVEAGREEDQGAPSGTGYSRAEPSGLGPEAEYPSRMQWRPIETAPTDGSRYLGAANGVVFECVWFWGVPMPIGAAVKLQCHLAASHTKPTHWTPLPPPPAQGTEARSAETERLGPKDDGPVAEGHAPDLTEAGRLAIKEA